MIDSIFGTVEYLDGQKAVIDVGSISLVLYCSNITMGILAESSGKVKIYVFLSIKENAIELYGFSTIEEREAFSKLITVPKVGPRIALNILSIYTYNELAYIIAEKDSELLSKASGVGKKLAENIVFTLKDKFKDIADVDFVSGIETDTDEVRNQALSALMALGFDRRESSKSINEVYSSDMSVEDLITLALKEMGR